MNESVIDIPRRTYAPNVFDDEIQVILRSRNCQG